MAKKVEGEKSLKRELQEAILLLERLMDDADERMVLATMLGIVTSRGINEFALGVGDILLEPLNLEEFVLLETEIGWGLFWKEDSRRIKRNCERLYRAVLHLAEKRILELEPEVYPGTEIQRILNDRPQFKVRLNLK